MISYKDRAYCASKGPHTCGREFTEQDAIKAEKWWGGEDYPVAWGEFCNKESMKKYQRCGQCEVGDNSDFSCFFLHASDEIKREIISEAAREGWLKQEMLLKTNPL